MSATGHKCTCCAAAGGRRHPAASARPCQSRLAPAAFLVRAARTCAAAHSAGVAHRREGHGSGTADAAGAGRAGVPVRSPYSGSHSAFFCIIDVLAAAVCSPIVVATCLDSDLATNSTSYIAGPHPAAGCGNVRDGTRCGCLPGAQRLHRRCLLLEFPAAVHSQVIFHYWCAALHARVSHRCDGVISAAHS